MASSIYQLQSCDTDNEVNQTAVIKTDTKQNNDWLKQQPVKVRQHEITQVVKGAFKCVGFLVTQSFFFFSSFEKDFSGLLQFPPEYCKSSAPHTHKDEYMDLIFWGCVVGVNYSLHNAFDKGNGAHSWEKINRKLACKQLQQHLRYKCFFCCLTEVLYQFQLV